jgi:hypothetical protein
MRVISIASGVVFLVHGAIAQAQVRFEPRALRDDPLKVSLDGSCANQTAPEDPASVSVDAVGELNRRYHAGDWDRIQQTAKYLLDRARCSAGTAGETAPPDLVAYDYRAHYIWLTWIGADAFDTYGLHRLLVHHRPSAPYKVDLPGVSRLYEVFVSDSKTAELTSILTSTEKADETLAQIPAVVDRIVPALFGLVTGVGGLGPSVIPVRQTKELWATPYQIDLPVRRASIAVKSVVGAPVLGKTFNDDADRFGLKTGFQTSLCAHDLAIAATNVVKDVRAHVTCQPGGARQACLDRFDTGLRQAFDTQRKVTSCSPDAEQRAMASVDAAFRAFVTTGMAREVKSDTVVTNIPRQRLSFGLVEAVAFKAGVQDPRVTLDDDGNVKADPLPRLLTILTVNSSFKGYDRSAISPSRAEQWRWFGGAVIAPDFGVAAGFSYLPVRGLAIDVGVAGLFVKSAPAGAIGRPPASATDPFDLGTAWAVFAGAGYNFK